MKFINNICIWCRACEKVEVNCLSYYHKMIRKLIFCLNFAIYLQVHSQSSREVRESFPVRLLHWLQIFSMLHSHLKWNCRLHIVQTSFVFLLDWIILSMIQIARWFPMKWWFEFHRPVLIKIWWKTFHAPPSDHWLPLQPFCFECNNFLQKLNSVFWLAQCQNSFHLISGFIFNDCQLSCHIPWIYAH